MALRADRVGVRADQVDSFGRVISPSFLNEIMEDLPEWTDLPVRVNGTEELIPSNPSVPVTSPILADIDYPDVRRNNQYFTYRESPTTVDGLAKIKSIKGNTLVWNQLIQNGNFSDSKGWGGQQASLSVSNNEATITGSSNYARLQCTNAYIPTVIANHKYLLIVDVKKNKALSDSSSAGGAINIRLGNHTVRVSWDVTSVNTWKTYHWFILPTSSSESASNTYFYLADCGTMYESGYEASVRNVSLFDLTAMFGSTKADEIYAMEQSSSGSGLAYFRSLFPLPYYDHNTGALLSFNGTGIKTTNEDDTEEHTTNLPVATYFPTGMKSAGSVYDELTPSKAITRIGSRAYQSGDESNTSVITDGTNTYYALATPIELPTLSFE